MTGDITDIFVLAVAFCCYETWPKIWPAHDLPVKKWGLAIAMDS